MHCMKISFRCETNITGDQGQGYVPGQGLF